MSLQRQTQVDKQKTIGIFVAWPYANGELHLGHVAGAYLPADIFARYHRLKGSEVMMVSGSDAHGTPITLKAREEGITPLEVVQKYHTSFTRDFINLGISFDLFTSTLTSNHAEVSRSVFRKLKENGDLTLKSEKQFFDPEVKLFLPDRYVNGECPKCEFESARGDQCDNCGATYETLELKNPRSKLSTAIPEIRETEHYFFDLSRYADQLEKYLEEQPHWRSAVLNYSLSQVQAGLRERPITRDLEWGVKVPVDEFDESKSLYVWFEAVIGYLSASIEYSNKYLDTDSWHKWWKNGDAKSYYFIGKDNVPFHSIIWPVELMAFDESLNLPFDVPANQFLNFQDQKLSKSRGIGISIKNVLESFDSDTLRYYLCSVSPENKDTSFSWEDLVARNNGELVAAWGNLVNRVLGFSFKKFGEKIPEQGEFEEIDLNLIEKIKSTFITVGDLIEKVELRDALKEAISTVREVNKYLDQTAPWTTIKTDEQKARTSIYIAILAIDNLKVVLSPFLPTSSQKVHELLGYKDTLFGEQYTEAGDKIDILSYKKKECTASVWKYSEITGGGKILKPSPLYSLLDLEEIESGV